MPLPVVGGIASVEVADLGGGGQTSQERDVVLAGLGYTQDASAFWSVLAWPSTGASLLQFPSFQIVTNLAFPRITMHG